MSGHISLGVQRSAHISLGAHMRYGAHASSGAHTSANTIAFMYDFCPWALYFGEERLDCFPTQIAKEAGRDSPSG